MVTSSTNIDYTIRFIQWYAMCAPKKIDTPLSVFQNSVVLHILTYLEPQ